MVPEWEVAMVKRGEVLQFVDEVEKVNVVLLCERFSLPEDKAWRVLLRLVNEGLLAPVTTAFFTKPANGSLVDMRRSAPDWYESKMAVVFDFLESRGMGVTVKDVSEALDLHVTGARALLKMMVDQEKLICRESRYGGLYGKRPMIFGSSEKALDDREVGLKERATEVRKKKRKKKAKPELVAESGGGRDPVVEANIRRLKEIGDQLSHGWISREYMRFAKANLPSVWARILAEGPEIRA